MSNAAATATKPARIFVGVDGGHYGIKIAAEDGQLYYVPSRAKSGKQTISMNGDDEFYETEEGKIFTVHEHVPDFEDTRFEGYHKSELNRVLIHHALKVAGYGGKFVSITTGLPVSYYYDANGERNEVLIKAKSENLSKKVICGSSPLAKIARNIVSTEAIAAYFNELMDLNGDPSKDYDELRESAIGVIDVGGKTTDAAVVLPGGQQVDSKRSGSSDIGILNLNEHVGARLKSTFGLDNVPARLLESAIKTGNVKIAGKVHDVSKMVDEQKELLADQIMSMVRAKVGRGLDLDKILFVGGGSVALRAQLSKNFEHSVFPEHPEFANALGMLKIGKYIFGDEE